MILYKKFLLFLTGQGQHNKETQVGNLIVILSYLFEKVYGVFTSLSK